MSSSQGQHFIRNARVEINRRTISIFDRLNEHLLKCEGATESVLPVIEFPKSGGTWIAKMLAIAVGVPYLDDCKGIIGRPCTIRTHWRPSPQYQRAVYVVRDVRDIFISLFHHRERNAKNNSSLSRRYIDIFGEPLSVDKFDGQITGFIANEMTGWGGGVKYSWNIQVENAFECAKANPKVALVKYEDVLRDTPGVLQRTIQTVYGKEVGFERAELVSELFKAKHQPAVLNTGEKTFFRSGSVGEWRKTLPKEAARLIADNYNENLISFGYESDKNWWRELD